jgi:aspartate carbamoyltransferase regulatory subunit
MNVDGVRTGIVIDHIPAGKSMEIYRLLHLDKLTCSIAIVQNAQSTKYGKKDIIKIDENISLNLDVLGFVDPDITVNMIQDGQLTKKKHLELPGTLTGVIRCKNPRCITTVEQEIVHSFKLTDREKRQYSCVYCDTAYKE